MWVLQNIVLCAILGGYCVIAGTCSVSEVRIAFLIDASGSVLGVKGSFERQVVVANAVLRTVRDIFTEHDESDKLHWGAITFGGNATIIKDMHMDQGTDDVIDETVQTACHADRLGIFNTGACTTHYKVGLEKAIAMLQPEEHPDAKNFIWFLTDGEPYDSEFREGPLGAYNAPINIKFSSIEEFRKKTLEPHAIQSVCSYLTPKSENLEQAEKTLKIICDDNVLIGALDSFDSEKYTSDAETMFRDAVKTAAFVCEPALWATVAIVIAAIIGALCCCLAGAKAKKHFFEEEEGKEMTQVFAPTAATSSKRNGQKSRPRAKKDRKSASTGKV